MTSHRHTPSPRITAVILAGGAGRRMGGEDKGLLPLDGRPLIDFVIARLRTQSDGLFINCNRNRERYEQFGFPLLEDSLPGAGPLAGLLSALEAERTDNSDYVISVPCDTPLLPRDLVARMLSAMQQSNAEVCTVDDGERLHPVIMLVRRSVAAPLRDYLERGGRKVHDWFYSRRHCCADFSAEAAAFININTPQQLHALQQRLHEDEQ